MIMFFKMLCLSFATVALCAFFLFLVLAWQSMNPKNSQEEVDRHSDHLYQCVHVSMWTLLAAGVNGVVWCVLECLYYFWTLPQ